MINASLRRDSSERSNISQVISVTSTFTLYFGSRVLQERDISIFSASQLSSDALSCTIELKGRDDWDHRNQGLSSIGNTKDSPVNSFFHLQYE